jgi:hypothetical protein
MTDRFAINTFEQLYVPRQWAVLGGVRASVEGE